MLGVTLTKAREELGYVLLRHVIDGDQATPGREVQVAPQVAPI
ncbi:MAG: hypothetical protein QOI06_2389 [Nocardioidaceae bacterium]|jgi:hypothetical protein|nr:hypothetical protein [Nocardioidaceae bacterium]